MTNDNDNVNNKTCNDAAFISDFVIVVIAKKYLLCIAERPFLLPLTGKQFS